MVHFMEGQSFQQEPWTFIRNKGETVWGHCPTLQYLDSPCILHQFYQSLCFRHNDDSAVSGTWSTCLQPTWCQSTWLSNTTQANELTALACEMLQVSSGLCSLVRNALSSMGTHIHTYTHMKSKCSSFTKSFFVGFLLFLVGFFFFIFKIKSVLLQINIHRKIAGIAVAGKE